MEKQKIFFTIILLSMCFLLYLGNHCLSVSNTAITFRHTDHRKEFKGIPSITVFSTDKLSEINQKCEQRLQPWEITISWGNKWQKLKNHHISLYSAYDDARIANGRYIRIIAMSKGKFDGRILCRVWFRSADSSVAELQVDELWISAWDNAKPEFYRPLLLSCPVTRNSTPIAVSVISRPCEQPSNVFWLNTTTFSDEQKDFVVCLKPVNFQQDISSRFLEWIELQFILGADNIVVYKYHLHPKTSRVLQNYETSERVTIIEYSLPGGNPKGTDELAQFLARETWQKRRHEMTVYNDCFYRHIHSHKYVINLDLDEAIIPLKHDSWSGLLNDLNPKVLQSASISVPNVYFFENFGDESNSTVPKYFNMLRHLQRSSNFTPPGFAQKSFFPTKYAKSVSNHYALRSLHPGMRTNTIISKNLAQMHHYRASCPPKMEKECQENYMKFHMRDPTLLRFKDRLVKKVLEKKKELNL